MLTGTAKAPGQHPINPPRPWVPMYDSKHNLIGRARLVADETLEWETDDPAAVKLLTAGFSGGLMLGGERPDGADTE